MNNPRKLLDGQSLQREVGEKAHAGRQDQFQHQGSQRDESDSPGVNNFTRSHRLACSGFVQKHAAHVNSNIHLALTQGAKELQLENPDVGTGEQPN